MKLKIYRNLQRDSIALQSYSNFIKPRIEPRIKPKVVQELRI